MYCMMYCMLNSCTLPCMIFFNNRTVNLPCNFCFLFLFFFSCLCYARFFVFVFLVGLCAVVGFVFCCDGLDGGHVRVDCCFPFSFCSPSQLDCCFYFLWLLALGWKQCWDTTRRWCQDPGPPGIGTAPMVG